jgi:hypothetical protein
MPQRAGQRAALDGPFGARDVTDVRAAPGLHCRRIGFDPALDRHHAQQVGLGADRPAADAAPVRPCS